MAFSVDVNNQSCLCEKFLIKRRLDHFLAGTCTGARGRARTLLSDRPVPVSQLFLIDEVVVHVLRVVDSKIGPRPLACLKPHLGGEEKRGTRRAHCGRVIPYLWPLDGKRASMMDGGRSCAQKVDKCEQYRVSAGR